jgi:hypothetical protein
MSSNDHNTIIIIGTLGMQGRDRVMNVVRQGDRAILEKFMLQTVTAFGQPCALEIEVSPATPGCDLIVRANVGKPIAIEGELRRRAELDRRYAVAEQDPGARMLRYRIHVHAIRQPQADEPITTFARLTGTVSTEPIFQNHRSLADTEIARVSVQVSCPRPSAYPGSRAIINELTEISVTIPISHEDAPKLLRPGNVVEIEGSLDSVMVPQTRNQAAAAKLRQLDTAWAGRRENLSAKEYKNALRDYRRERARYAEVQALSVVAGYVVALAGMPRGVEEARMAAQERNRAGRLQRLAARAGRAPAVAAETPPATPAIGGD